MSKRGSVPPSSLTAAVRSGARPVPGYKSSFAEEALRPFVEDAWARRDQQLLARCMRVAPDLVAQVVCAPTPQMKGAERRHKRLALLAGAYCEKKLRAGAKPRGLCKAAIYEVIASEEKKGRKVPERLMYEVMRLYDDVVPGLRQLRKAQKRVR